MVCAAALAVLDVIEAEGLLQNARDAGRATAGRAGRDFPAYRGPGAGLLLGAALEAERAGDVVRALIAKGALATEAGPGVVRVTPPLIVTPAEVEEFAAAFAGAAGEMFA